MSLKKVFERVLKTNKIVRKKCFAETSNQCNERTKLSLKSKLVYFKNCIYFLSTR